MTHLKKLQVNLSLEHREEDDMIFNFKKFNLVIGLNGSGKTYLLNEIFNNAQVDDIVYISGKHKAQRIMTHYEDDKPVSKYVFDLEQKEANVLGISKYKNALILLDEVETGFDHIMMKYEVWKRLVTSAEMNDLQIIATTLSWGCIGSFLEATKDNNGINALVHRMTMKERSITSQEITHDNMLAAYEFNMEMRG